MGALGLSKPICDLSGCAWPMVSIFFEHLLDEFYDGFRYAIDVLIDGDGYLM